MTNIVTATEASNILNMNHSVCMGLMKIYQTCIRYNLSFDFNERKFIDNKLKKYPEYRFIRPIPFIDCFTGKLKTRLIYKYQLYYYNFFNERKHKNNDNSSKY